MEEENALREREKETSVSFPKQLVLPTSAISLPDYVLSPKAIASFLTAGAEGAEGEESPPSTPLPELQCRIPEVYLVPAVAAYKHEMTTQPASSRPAIHSHCKVT